MSSPPQALSGRLDADVRADSLKAAFVQALFWAITFGAGESNLSLFAAHIHAPDLFYGLLAGVPQLLGPLIQILSANLLDRYGATASYLCWPVFANSICLLGLAFLPCLDSSFLLLGAFLCLVCFYYGTNSFVVPPWTSVISVLVPTVERQRYFARLTHMVTLISLLTQLLVGAMMYWARYQEHTGTAGLRTAGWIFASCFLIAGLARLNSFRILRRVYCPPHEVRSETTFTFWQFIRRVRESNFVRFILFVAMVHFGANIVGPYCLPYFRFHLHYGEWEWILLGLAASVAVAATLLFWGKFSDRFGNRQTLVLTSYLVAFVPLVWLATEDFYLLLLSNVLGGLAWGGFGLATWNYILEAVSAPKRARCVAYFSVITGGAIFLGSLLGGWLSEMLPLEFRWGGRVFAVEHSITYLLLLSCLLRFGAALFMSRYFKELRVVESFNLRDWVFQIVVARGPAGVRFSPLAPPPSPDEAPLVEPGDLTEARAHDARAAECQPVGPPCAVARRAEDSRAQEQSV